MVSPILTIGFDRKVSQDALLAQQHGDVGGGGSLSEMSKLLLLFSAGRNG
jgi:hypothetical protein